MKKIVLVVGLLCSSLSRAADLPNVAVDSPSPTITRWADRCTDFTSNGWAFKAPRNFLQWLEVFSDPGIWLEFARRGMDPQYYVRSMSSVLDPGTPKNYLEWTDPEIYNKWARAAAEPDFYTAVNAILFDPGRYLRWAMLPIDARSWNLLATAVNPETWGQWLVAPLRPDTQQLLKKALDPETAWRWSQALTDPALKATLVPLAQPARVNPYLQVPGLPGKSAL